jgi:23S rRNA pseudouridine1911/1915/1917 synthase
MTDRVVVAAAGGLLDVLAAALPSWSRATLKQRLRLGCLVVNGAVALRHDQVLQPGDAVEIRAKDAGEAATRSVSKLPVLHVDDELIAIDKPPKLLSVSTDDERQRTALAMVRASLSRPGRPAALWPVHRLDRETSGVLLFARTLAARDAVQADWAASRKVYVAVVEGRPEPPRGTIDQPLWEDAQLRVHVGEAPDSKPARTHFATLRTRSHRSLLEVELDTGRKHQIRAHLAWLGHPIVGDDRYGTGDARLGLHAARLELRHPRDGRLLRLEAPMPASLRTLLEP